jgi:hypothetical protein
MSERGNMKKEPVFYLFQIHASKESYPGPGYLAKYRQQSSIFFLTGQISHNG